VFRIVTFWFDLIAENTALYTHPTEICSDRLWVEDEVVPKTFSSRSVGQHANSEGDQAGERERDQAREGLRTPIG